MMTTNVNDVLSVYIDRLNNVYEYQYRWFLDADLGTTIFHFLEPGQPLNILEIGSYEGLSACFFSDTLLSHPQSRLVCVDPFDLSDPTTPLTSVTEERFLRNISNSVNASKISTYRMTSDEYFANRQGEDILFDFVYIDGSHVPEHIISDFDNAFSCTKRGGIIWFDDYQGNGDMRITNAIDQCITRNQGHLDIIFDGRREIAIRKK